MTTEKTTKIDYFWPKMRKYGVFLSQLYPKMYFLGTDIQHRRLMNLMCLVIVSYELKKVQNKIIFCGARKKKVSAMPLWVTQFSLIEVSLRSNLSLGGKCWPLDLRKKISEI